LTPKARADAPVPPTEASPEALATAQAIVDAQLPPGPHRRGDIYRSWIRAGWRRSMRARSRSGRRTRAGRRRRTWLDSSGDLRAMGGRQRKRPRTPSVGYCFGGSSRPSHRRIQSTHLHPSRTMEMEKIIIRALLSNACLFQPFRTRSDCVDTLTIPKHQYETWPLWDEFSKSHSPPPELPRYSNGCKLMYVEDGVAPCPTHQT
jgi:hypothetical protein